MSSQCEHTWTGKRCKNKVKDAHLIPIKCYLHKHYFTGTFTIPSLSIPNMKIGAISRPLLLGHLGKQELFGEFVDEVAKEIVEQNITFNVILYNWLNSTNY